MGNQWPVEFNNFLIAKVQFIFAIVICSCTCSSLCDGADRFTDVGSHDQCSTLFPLPEKFIMKSFFPKHHNWSHLHVQDFLRHKAPMFPCVPPLRNPTFFVLKRHLIGEGSHRRLYSSLIIKSPLEYIPSHSCKILIIENLPLGVFADPFELERLFQRGVFKDVAVFGDTDLELPTVLSGQSLVEIHLDVGINLSILWNAVKIDIELPLHARYPPLEESGHVSVQFSQPEILLSCSSNNGSSCLAWAQKSDAGADTAVVWEIACGIKAHTGVVSFLTFASAFLSAILIIAISFGCSFPSPRGNVLQTKSKNP